MISKTLPRIALLLAVFSLCGLTVNSADAANRTSAWGWKKPLNEKPGSMLYTSNRALRRTSSVRTYPVQTYPVQIDSVRTYPVQTYPVQTSPVQTYSARPYSVRPGYGTSNRQTMPRMYRVQRR
ncbi:hypothetical protein Pla52n_21090 [Stieleria varia]|uniref:Secreted protein n=2 Tax=Stieleria varia TaxID=2528005 RepID=A0A5C6B390_9BACT|nr:hypothetical protein Pla52n_21090 [Stieleria varia]